MKKEHFQTLLDQVRAPKQTQPVPSRLSQLSRWVTERGIETRKTIDDTTHRLESLEAAIKGIDDDLQRLRDQLTTKN